MLFVLCVTNVLSPVVTLC